MAQHKEFGVNECDEREDGRAGSKRVKWSEAERSMGVMTGGERTGGGRGNEGLRAEEREVAGE